jgi:hypothetical protein
MIAEAITRSYGNSNHLFSTTGRTFNKGNNRKKCSIYICKENTPTVAKTVFRGLKLVENTDNKKKRLNKLPAMFIPTFHRTSPK